MKTIYDRYWHTSEYVKDIARDNKLAIGDVWREAGPLKINCTGCEATIVYEKRVSRTERYFELCQKCTNLLWLENLEANLSGLAKTVSLLRKKVLTGLDISNVNFAWADMELQAALGRFRERCLAVADEQESA